MSTAPLEGHAIAVTPTGAGLDIVVSTQWPHGTRAMMARMFGLPLDAVRVRVPAVGGGFGGKTLGGIREHIAVAAAAQQLETPLRWIEDRRDNLQSMQGRGARLRYEADIDDGGRVLALRVDDLCDAGAYPTTGSVEPGKSMLMSTGPYRIPSITFAARSVVTNLPPPGAYRGPGRAEASMMLEHLMDNVARAVRLDPFEVRLRNAIHHDELPREAVTGAHYDVTDFPALIARVRELGEYKYWRSRCDQQPRTNPQVLGIGVSLVFDSSAWFERRDTAHVSLRPDGCAVVEMASSSAGQHHDAAVARMVGDELGLGREYIALHEGDSAYGMGSGSSGSRTIQITANAARAAAAQLRTLVLQRAADLLEAAVADLDLADGAINVRGVPGARITFADIAAQTDPADLVATCSFEQAAATYPSVATIAVVEVDRETGCCQVIRLVTVADCGNVLDPPAALGQLVGASVQAIGQVLFERAAYDDTGNPRNSNLAEYLMPSAADVVSPTVEFMPFPTARNPSGAKGVGELGMVSAPAAIANAIVDALHRLGAGAAQVPVPAEPAAVWAATHGTNA